MRNHSHSSFLNGPVSRHQVIPSRLAGRTTIPFVLALVMAATVAPNASAELTLTTADHGASTMGAQHAANVRTPSRVQSITLDQKFLRVLADHYEGMRAVAHDRMMDAGGHAAHGKQNDPASLDGESDMLQAETLKLLSTLYHDEYSARPAKFGIGEHGSVTASNGALNDAQSTTNQKRVLLREGLSIASGAGSGAMSGVQMSTTATAATTAMEASHDKARAETAARFRDTIAAIDSFRGKLHRREVKELAARHRLLLERWLAELGAAA